MKDKDRADTNETEHYTAEIVEREYRVWAVRRTATDDIQERCQEIIVIGCIDSGEAVNFFKDKYGLKYWHRVRAEEVVADVPEEPKRGRGRPRKVAVA